MIALGRPKSTPGPNVARKAVHAAASDDALLRRGGFQPSCIGARPRQYQAPGPAPFLPASFGGFCAGGRLDLLCGRASSATPARARSGCFRTSNGRSSTKRPLQIRRCSGSSSRTSPWDEAASRWKADPRPQPRVKLHFRLMQHLDDHGEALASREARRPAGLTTHDEMVGVAIGLGVA